MDRNGLTLAVVLGSFEEPDLNRRSEGAGQNARARLLKKFDEELLKRIVVALAEGKAALAAQRQRDEAEYLDMHFRATSSC